MATSSENELSILDKVEFFNGLDSDSKAFAINCSTKVSIDQGSFLFFQGDPADAFYIVSSGQIRLTQVNELGEQVIHYFPGRGDAIGIIVVLRGVDYPVTAQAAVSSELLKWDQETLKSLLFKYPQLAINSIQILSNYIFDFQNKIQALSNKNMESRVAHAILQLLAQAGEQDADGMKISFRVTRSEIAQMAGTTLYSVSRTLSQWEREEIVSLDHDSIHVTEIEKLQELSGSTLNL